MSTHPREQLSPGAGHLSSLILAGLLALCCHAGAASAASAANFVIPAGTASATFDGAARGVQPGQVIELAAGVHGPLTFRNIIGTASQPVVIRSAANGQAIIRRVSPKKRRFRI